METEITLDDAALILATLHRERNAEAQNDARIIRFGLRNNINITYMNKELLLAHNNMKKMHENLLNGATNPGKAILEMRKLLVGLFPTGGWQIHLGTGFPKQFAVDLATIRGEMFDTPHVGVCFVCEKKAALERVVYPSHHAFPQVTCALCFVRVLNWVSMVRVFLHACEWVNKATI